MNTTIETEIDMAKKHRVRVERANGVVQMLKFDHDPTQSEIDEIIAGIEEQEAEAALLAEAERIAAEAAAITYDNTLAEQLNA